MKKYYALFDIDETGKYEDDIVRYARMTKEEADNRNKILFEKGARLRWTEDTTQSEDQHDNTPSLDMNLYY